MAAGRLSVQVKTMHEFMTGLESGGGSRWTKTRPRILWIHFWTVPGIADQSAYAARTEAVLRPTAAYLEGASDAHAEGEFRHGSR